MGGDALVDDCFTCGGRKEIWDCMCGALSEWECVNIYCGCYVRCPECNNGEDE